MFSFGWLATWLDGLVPGYGAIMAGGLLLLAGLIVVGAILWVVS